MRKEVVVTVVLLATLLAGCGGGGGGGMVAPLPQLRQMRAGDTWNYRVTLTDGMDRVVTTARIRVDPATGIDLVGNTYRLVEITFGPPANIDVIAYLSQDLGGSVWQHGDFTDGAEELVAAPYGGKVLVTKSPFVVGDRYQYNISYNTGAWESGSTEVVVRETVTVPAGTYEAYRVARRTCAGGVTALTTHWYVPEVGHIVRGVMELSVGTTTYQCTLEMTSATRGK